MNEMNISEYDFKKRPNADCNPRGEMINTLVDAKNICKNNKQCQGVIESNISDSEGYYVCPTNATTLFGNDIKTSLFEKIIIGKIC